MFYLRNYFLIRFSRIPSLHQLSVQTIQIHLPVLTRSKYPVLFLSIIIEHRNPLLTFCPESNREMTRMITIPVYQMHPRRGRKQILQFSILKQIHLPHITVDLLLQGQFPQNTARIIYQINRISFILHKQFPLSCNMIQHRHRFHTKRSVQFRLPQNVWMQIFFHFLRTQKQRII